MKISDFHKDIYPQLKKDYIDTGLAKIEFRHFPLDVAAFNASKVSQCKSDQSLEILESLYSNQLEWVKGNTAEEINNNLNYDLEIKNMDKVFQIIIKSAIFEFLYKPNTSIKIIINEYLKASNFFIDDSQTKYLNALLDKISKKIRISNE